MKALKIIFKVLLFPLSLLLSVIVPFTMFIVERLAGLLNILSILMLVAALAGYSQYLFGWPVGPAGEASMLQLAIIGTVFAFVLSPFGLPLLGMLLIGKLDDLNDAIKSI